MASKNKIEDPDRIKIFLEKTGSLAWDDARASLEVLYKEAFELLRHEVAYYYRIRQSKKILSGWFRFCALLFGTLGVLAPLADAAKLYDVGELGYLLLAIAGAFITANNIFGGTSGHARFVTTQLSLEQIIAIGAVKWNQLKMKHQIEKNKESVEQEMLDFIVSTIEASYKLILEETSEWNDALKSALTDYEKRFKQGK